MTETEDEARSELKVKQHVKKTLAQPWFTKMARLWSTNSLAVLAYHRIRRTGEVTPLADSLFGPEEEQFDRQVAWLAKNTHPMSETDVLSHVTLRRPFPRRATLVTFDDGYIDNYTIAAPILKRYGVPAIYFIPAAPISERTLFWWDEIANMVKRSKASHLTINGHNFELTPDGRLQAIDWLTVSFKRSSAPGRFVLMEELRHSLEVDKAPQELADAALMNWAQIKALSDYGVSVGCHSVDHCVLSQLDETDQENNLRHSKAELEERTGRPVLSVAYPYGGKEYFNAATLKAARKVGFRLGFSLAPGGNYADRLDEFSIGRLIPASTIDSFILQFTISRFRKAHS